MLASTTQKIALLALLLAGVAVWIVCLYLLIQVTASLLDTLRVIIELAQMS